MKKPSFKENSSGLLTLMTILPYTTRNINDYAFNLRLWCTFDFNFYKSIKTCSWEITFLRLNFVTI